MANPDDKLAKKVVSAASLLFEAVKKLEGGESSQPATSSPASSDFNCNTLPIRDRGGVHSELSSLFSWNAGSSVGSSVRSAVRKGKRPLHSFSQGSKKKKLKTWTHTFVCLASTSQKYSPDTSERTSLKLAGLGEKRIPVFAYSAALELQDELFREFPKLRDGGGYELLRASDVGGKELMLIDIPQGGYSVDYLRGVVKSAKIYIRPLQKDLDIEPLENKVQ